MVFTILKRTLEGIIHALASAVEAMSSHRPYRPALGIDKALEEIEKNKGKLYCPHVVDVYLKIFTEKEFRVNKREITL